MAKIVASESSESRPIVRLASSCAWKRAFERGEEALRQLRGGELAPDVGDDPRHVGRAVGVGQHDDTALAVFAQDLVGAVAFPHLGDVAHGHPAIGRLQQQVAQALRGALSVVEAQHDVKAARAVHQLGDDAAVGESLQLLGDRLRLQAVEGGPRVVDHDFELRDAHLLFDLQVGQAVDFRETAAEVLGERAQRIEILAEEFDDDLRPHAREHVIEPVRDGLADIERDRQHGKARAHIGDNDILAAAPLLQVDLDLRGVDAFGMLIELGAAGAPANGLDLGHLRAAAFRRSGRRGWTRRARCRD